MRPKLVIEGNCKADVAMVDNLEGIHELETPAVIDTIKHRRLTCPPVYT